MSDDSTSIFIQQASLESSFILKTSMLMTIYLSEYTEYMNTQQVVKSNSKLLPHEKIAFVILKLIMQSICNAFTIKKGRDDAMDEKILDFYSIISYGTGMYPSAAMMNHSCRPNIITSFYNNTLVVRSNRTIFKGEEVFNCYGPNEKNMTTNERREMLKSQFFFDCKCFACEPITSTSSPADVDETSALICSSCRQPFSGKAILADIESSFRSDNGTSAVKECPSCNGEINYKWYDEMLEKANLLRNKGKHLLEEDRYDEALKTFLDADKLYYTFVHEYNYELYSNNLDIGDCYLILGDYNGGFIRFFNNLERGKKNLDAKSVEYIKLVMKTTDIALLDGIEIDKTTIQALQKYYEEVKFAIEINFGLWSKQYKCFPERAIKLANILK